jgi:ferredoxin-NADP reductase
MKGAASNLWTRLADVAGLVATPLSPSHYIGLFRPLAATHTLHARVEALHAETADVTTLTLRPGRGWRSHLAGQHVRVGLAIAGRIATRTYSISSPPERGDGCITITVKAQGRVSNALCAAAPGSYVSLGLPEGEFRPRGERLLFVTGGSGITPVASILRSFAARDAMPDIEHVHYAREEVIFGDELAALPYRLHVVRTAHERRRFDRGVLDALVPDWQARETLACGPPSLLDAAAFTNPRVERFTAALAAPANASGGRVRFAASRVSAVADGRTPLLRIAEDAGVSAPHGCRMGICHTCDATLTAGCVRDLRTQERIDTPGARVQICVCAAAGDVELAL